MLPRAGAQTSAAPAAVTALSPRTLQEAPAATTGSDGAEVDVLGLGVERERVNDSISIGAIFTMRKKMSRPPTSRTRSSQIGVPRRVRCAGRELVRRPDLVAPWRGGLDRLGEVAVLQRGALLAMACSVAS